MRRKDKQVADVSVLHDLMNSVDTAYLAVMQADGYPRAIPLNFAWLDDTVYFHGARGGEKYELLQKSPPVSMCIAQELSVIPPEMLGNQACEATQFYRSAMIYGHAALVDDEKEKIRSLRALLIKHGAEEQSLRHYGTDTESRSKTAATAVFKLPMERWVLKENLGAQLEHEMRMKVMKTLEQGDPADKLTARYMAEAMELNR